MEEKLLTQMPDLKETVVKDDAEIMDLLKNLSKEMKIQNELLGTLSKELDTSASTEYGSI